MRLEFSGEGSGMGLSARVVRESWPVSSDVNLWQDRRIALGGAVSMGVREGRES